MGSMTRLALGGVTVGVLLAACGVETPAPERNLAAGIEDSGRLVEAIRSDSTVVGELDAGVSTYGYLVEGRTGAVLTAHLDGIANAIVQIWGPFEGASEPGDLLADGEGTLSADIAEQGQYLVVFSPEQADGAFELDLSCQGSAEQCARPAWNETCQPRAVYYEGGSLQEDTLWDACEYVLRETVTVAEGASLTIAPGVSVQGALHGRLPFGDTFLMVEGTLIAQGTAEAPIAFSALDPAEGWGGLRLAGEENILSHVVVEGAEIAVDLWSGATAALTDAVLEGSNVRGSRSSAGIHAALNVEADFERALVRGFDTGLWLANARMLFVEDSVIRANGTGLRVDGLVPVSSCANEEELLIPEADSDVDPVILHTDIVDNEGAALEINGSDVFVYMERSNVLTNGSGIELRGLNLKEGSGFVANNIHSNGAGSFQPEQIFSYHRLGPVNISDNYWLSRDDIDVSQNWRLMCDQSEGEFVVEGVANEAHADAGPRAHNINERVRQASWRAAPSL